MKRSPIATAALLLLSAMAAASFTGAPTGAAAADTPPVTAKRKDPVHIGGVLDSGQFLPDTTVLARVNDRVLRIYDFVDAFFSSYAQFRPRPDAPGRLEFLNSMVNKEVMALTALAIDRPLGFEDRTTLRAHTQTVLANVLFKRAVLDSIRLTEADILHAYQQFGWEQHLRQILFPDRATAEQVREALVARKLTWSAAASRYATAASGAHAEGDLGWVSRRRMNPMLAQQVFDLKPGEISPVVFDSDGYHVMQALERRTVEPPPFESLRKELAGQMRAFRGAERASRLQVQVGRQIGIAYDTTNIAWAAVQFRGHEVVTPGAEGPVLNLSGSAPEFQPADTARVLAKHRNGRFTLGDFLHAYNAVTPVMRQPVSDLESFHTQLDAFVLEPYLADLARARGLEQDSLAMAMIEKKREEILVQHLYEDSVESKIWITPKERRKYYDDHIAQYTTFPSVRFAAIVRDSKAAADSLLARLRAGERAADILHADSLRGLTTGSIRTMRQDEGGAYHKTLFEELRPGQSTVSGPDREGIWLVLQLLEFDAGRQLPYDQVEHYVIESARNIRAEEQLKAFIARHSRRYRIETHPELVMQIRLVDSALD